jgi:hypothetical protein
MLLYSYEMLLCQERIKDESDEERKKRGESEGRVELNLCEGD